MDIDKRNIVAFTAFFFGLLGVILMGAAMGAQKEDCCKGTMPLTGGCATCNLNCSLTSKKWIDYKECCWEVEDNPLLFTMICAVIALGCIITTGVMGECMENCPACCQNCSACLVGFINILGLIFVVIVIVITMQTQSSKSLTACPDPTIGDILDLGGLVTASYIFMALGMIGSCVVAFMSSSCCQPKEDTVDGGGTGKE